MRARVGLACLLVASCASPSAPVDAPPRASASSAPRGEGAPLLPDGRVAARSVALTKRSVCALLVDATVWCFGPLYASDRAAYVVHEMPIPRTRALVSTTSVTYALTEDGRVFEWGFDPQLGALLAPRAVHAEGVDEIAAATDRLCVRRGAFADCRTASGEDPTPVSSEAVAIAARTNDACAATATTVVCMSSSSQIERRIPDVVELAASGTRTCARSRSGRVKCWQRAELDETEPFGGRAFSALEASPFGVCAVPALGPRVCLPDTAAGTESDASVALADALRPHRGVSSVALGGTGACFVDAGVLHCWGEADVGRREGAPTPVDLGDLASLRSARDVAVGAGRVCVLGMDDAVRCWGDTSSGATGLPAERAQLGPERVPGLPPIARLAAHRGMNCYVTKASEREPGGQLLCSGGFGPRLGAQACSDARFPCRRAPALVTTGVRDVALGDAFGCTVDEDGGARCWGRNDVGQLGAGDLEDAPSPRPVVDASGAPLRRVRKVAAGPMHACAILDPEPPRADGGGDVVCWGHDDPGVQGRPVPPPAEMPIIEKGWGMVRSVATPVPMPRPVMDVSARCAILAPPEGQTGAGGEVRCWGPDLNGNYAVTPARMGACDATRVVDACALGGRGVTCPMRGARIPAPYAGPAITSLALDDGRACWVDAEHHVSCRNRDDDAPIAGTLTLGPYAPTSACTAEPTRGARPPIASWSLSDVSGPFGAHGLSRAEIQTLVDVWSGPDLESCLGATPGVTFRFADAWGNDRVRLVYVGAPCEGLLDETDPMSTSKKLTPAGLALVKAMLVRPPPRPGREIP